MDSILNESRPDTDATKEEQIIKVKTLDSKRKDMNQHKNLRSYTKLKKRYTIFDENLMVFRLRSKLKLLNLYPSENLKNRVR